MLDPDSTLTPTPETSQRVPRADVRVVTSRYRASQPSFLDWAVLVFVCMAISIPYRNLFGVQILGATVHLQEIVLLAALGAALAAGIRRRLAKHQRDLCRSLLMMFALVVVVEAFRILFLQTSPLVFISHGRSYIPFVAALVIVSTPLRIGLDRSRKAVCAAALMSALSATYLFLLAPDVARALAGENDATASAEYSGRMLWTGGDAALLAPLVLLIRPLKLKALWWAALTAIAFALVLAQNRTLLAGYPLVVGAILWARSRSAKGLLIAAAALSVPSIAAMYLFFSFADDRSTEMLQQRLGLLGASDEVDRSMIEGRVPIYLQYLDRAADCFLLGQGLGSPMSIRDNGLPIYLSDVSVVSFALPFGACGLVLLGLFVYACLCGVPTDSLDRPTATGLRSVIVVALIASLNLDVWSRNMFVVGLAFIIASITARQQVAHGHRRSTDGPTSISGDLESSCRGTAIGGSTSASGA